MTVLDSVEMQLPNESCSNEIEGHDLSKPPILEEKDSPRKGSVRIMSLSGLESGVGLDTFTQISVSSSADSYQSNKLYPAHRARRNSFLGANDRTQILREVLGRTVRIRANSLNSDQSEGTRTWAATAGSPHRSPMISEESLQSDEHGVAGDLTSVGCAFSVVNLILGNAVFTLPYAFVMGGWVSAPVLVLSIGIFMWTSVLLGYTLQELQSRGVSDPDYGVVGEFAFGERFRPFFTLLCAGECFCMCVFLLVFIAEAITIPLRLSKEFLIAIAASCGVILSLIPKRFMAIVSVVGLALTMSCAVAVIAWGFNARPWQSSNSLHGTQGGVGLVYMASFVAICVADHPVFPALYSSAKTPGDFFNGLIYGFAFFAITALVLSSCAYFTFGSNVQSVVLLNVGHDTYLKPIVRYEWMETVANMVIAFRTLLVLPSFIRPVVGIVQDVGLRTFGCDWDLHVQRKRGYRVSLIIIAFGLCGIAAFTVQDFLPEIEALTGSLFKSINALIIPCWSYTRLCKPTSAMKRLAIHIVIFGAVVWAVYGTYSAVATIIDRETNS